MLFSINLHTVHREGKLAKVYFLQFGHLSIKFFQLFWNIIKKNLTNPNKSKPSPLSNFTLYSIFDIF